MPCFPLPAVALLSLAVYLVGIAWLGEPGVVGALVSVRALFTVFLLGPGATLLALQGVIVVSSRVNDARTAQQVGALLIVPLSGLLIAQFLWSSALSTSVLAAIGAGCFALWALLLAASVALFRRETILTRWR